MGNYSGFGASVSFSGKYKNISGATSLSAGSSGAEGSLSVGYSKGFGASTTFGYGFTLWEPTTGWDILKL